MDIIHLLPSVLAFQEVYKIPHTAAGEHQLLEPKRSEQHLASEESGSPASK